MRTALDHRCDHVPSNNSSVIKSPRVGSSRAPSQPIAKPTVPNIYLDLRTTCATIPAGTLGLGFGNTSLSAAFEALAVRQGATLPSGLPAAKNDNRLFGITAQIAWMPKPSYQLTLRTPLYAVRN